MPTPYKITNWKTYNNALKQRGSVHIWIPKDIETTWYAKPTKKNGHPYIFSNTCIELMLVIRRIFRLPLRQTEGFIGSFLKHQMVAIPTYVTLCRRMGSISFSRKKQKEQDTHIVIDSTGVKVYGDGEWKRKKHGVEKRRKWKKLHVGMNEQGEIVAHEVTDEGTHDADVGRDMLKQSNATCFLGDGAFDHRKIYDVCKERGIEPIVPPRKDAVFWSDKSHPRNTALGIIKQYGRDVWKQTSGYTKRSVIESLMWRYKSCFGDRITTRRSDNQRADILIGCQILNVFRTLGMPCSVPAV